MDVRRGPLRVDAVKEGSGADEAQGLSVPDRSPARLSALSSLERALKHKERSEVAETEKEEGHGPQGGKGERRLAQEGKVWPSGTTAAPLKGR